MDYLKSIFYLNVSVNDGKLLRKLQMIFRFGLNKIIAFFYRRQISKTTAILNQSLHKCKLIQKQNEHLGQRYISRYSIYILAPAWFILINLKQPGKQTIIFLDNL